MCTSMSSKIVLSESEYRLLEKLKGKVEVGKRYRSDELAQLAGMEKSSIEALTRLLADKGVVKIETAEEELYEPTEEAIAYLREGFPEEKLVKLLEEFRGEVDVEEARKRLGPLFNIAIANAARKGWVVVRGGTIRLLKSSPSCEKERRALEEILETGKCSDRQVLRDLLRRKLLHKRVQKQTIVVFAVKPEDVLEKAVVEIGALTRDHLVSGLWRKLRLRAYNVAAEPPERLPGKLHFFKEFIEYLHDIMRELGFREVAYTPVELEFWNYDVLFQPQYHPARTPTDTFYLKNPSKGRVERELVEKVKVAHERGLAGSIGWAYPWKLEKALMLILRSHTTAVSARALAGCFGKLKPPFRIYTIGRVYRVEKVDPRHLPEFHQLDGIVGDYDVTFRDLMGLLAEILERLGIKEYKFKPAYFPFTEPSTEVMVRLGDQWLEVLGAGMFRPEMLEALGIDYNVAAWGMGIERLAMALYGLRDIRELYSRDVKYLRKIAYRWYIHASTQI